MRYFFSWWRLNLPLIWDPPDPSFSLLILYCFPFCLGCFISASVVAFLYSSVQFSHSVVYNSATPWTAARQASRSITNSWSLLKLMSIQSVMPSNHLILCGALLLLPSIFPSIRVFQQSVCRIRWPKNWSFSFSISHSNEYSGLISYRIDWLNLFAAQETLKSLL